MKKLPIGKQDFRQLIEGDFVYVDKTEYLIQLAESNVPVFLSRPRRFGKSLTISTFVELFSGNKELFKDTYACNHWDFEKIHPVIHFDFSTIFGETKELVSTKLYRLVIDTAEDLGISLKEAQFPELALKELIKKAGQKDPVVILIDEYDAPILDNLKNGHLGAIKNVFRAFYKIIKSSEKFIRFVFITGISKFPRVGVFSAMNNLDDITLSEDYAAITGYTQPEIKRMFPAHIQVVQEKLSLDEEGFWKKLAHYYNGYSWDGISFLYNPFSVLNCLKKKSFRPYWMATGSPSFIIEYAGDVRLEMTDFEGMQVFETFLEKKDIDKAAPASFLTQAGYLTIKKFADHKYTLDFPNHEVRRSFSDLLITSYYNVNDSDVLGIEENLRRALDEENTGGIINQFKMIYSSVPYIHFDSNKNEHFYSAILLMYLQAAGFDAGSERIGNKGRLDLSIKYNHTVYIIELKNDKPAVAIRQIHEKNYGGKYKNRKVINMGLQIDFEARNIVKSLVEVI